jgi:hypothetical protein
MPQVPAQGVGYELEVQANAEFAALEALPREVRDWLNTQAYNKCSAAQILQFLPVAWHNGYSIQDIVRELSRRDRDLAKRTQAKDPHGVLCTLGPWNQGEGEVW